MKTNEKQNWLKTGFMGAALLAGSLLAAGDPAHAANRPRPDFNGDGRADLAVGAPGEDVPPNRDAGRVHVIYGSPVPGLGPLTQDFRMGECTWPENGNTPGDGYGSRFGEVLAWGDFNGDHFDDLAIGIPAYNAPYPLGGMPETGMVYVLYGSNAGLLLNSTQVFVSTNIGGAPFWLNVNQNTFDRFGGALAAGDFNGDGRDDLAIGVPGQSGGMNGDIAEAGEVYVLYGRLNTGLDRATAMALTRLNRAHAAWIDVDPLGEPIAGDRFGSSLEAGDFNGDHMADLAIGVPGDTSGRGAVHVLYGLPAFGLTRDSLKQVFRQGAAGILGVPQAGEGFGTALAAGDFNGDARMDLAIGAPRATLPNGALLAGEVIVIYGGGIAIGLQPAGNQLWHQNVAGVLDDLTLGGEMFGAALATGDFNGDGRADLAIGAPHDAPGNLSSAGAVNVLYGGLAGLSAAGSQYWRQNSAGIDDTAAPHAQFGRFLTVADFNGNGAADLAIGMPGKVVGGVIGAGAVRVLYGMAGVGIAVAGNQLFTQNDAGDVAGVDDGFGSH